MLANFLSAGLPSKFSLEQESPDSYSDLPVFHRARTRQEPVPTGRTATTKFFCRAVRRGCPLLDFR